MDAGRGKSRSRAERPRDRRPAEQQPLWTSLGLLCIRSFNLPGTQVRGALTAHKGKRHCPEAVNPRRPQARTPGSGSKVVRALCHSLTPAWSLASGSSWLPTLDVPTAVWSQGRWSGPKPPHHPDPEVTFSFFPVWGDSSVPGSQPLVSGSSSVAP